MRDLQPYVGKSLEAKIIELDKNRNNVVLSRRAWLEETQKEQREDFLANLKPGEVRKGVVSCVVNFGAFVDLGGMDGLVHVSELSWKHVDHPGSVVAVGDEIEVQVLDVDLDRERISLSLKATQQDPWQEFATSHRVGELVYGRVTKLVPFGAFVQVGDGIEGLVHISEMSAHHVDLPEQVVTPGEELWVKIIDLDLQRRRISLSIKQAAEGGVVAAEYQEHFGEHAYDDQGNYIGVAAEHCPRPTRPGPSTTPSRARRRRPTPARPVRRRGPPRPRRACGRGAPRPSRRGRRPPEPEAASPRPRRPTSSSRLHTVGAGASAPASARHGQPTSVRRRAGHRSHRGHRVGQVDRVGPAGRGRGGRRRRRHRARGPAARHAGVRGHGRAVRPGHRRRRRRARPGGGGRHRVHRPEALADLNAIVHPAVGEEIADRMAALAETDEVVVLDVPLLVESKRAYPVAGLLVVDVDPEVAVRRLVEHRGMREDDVRARMARQATRDERLARADPSWTTAAPPPTCGQRVDAVWAWIEALRAG